MRTNYSHYTLVQASAGSGKTFRITEDLAAVIGGGKDPARIIATTFTKDAAAELAERISVKLVEKGKIVEAQEIDSALVGTVNSITDAIVRRFALQSGISPELSVLSENAEKLVFGDACDGVIASYENKYRELIESMGYDGYRNSFGIISGGQGSWKDSVQTLTTALRANAVDLEDPDNLESFIKKSQASLFGQLDLGKGEPETLADFVTKIAGAITKLHDELDLAIKIKEAKANKEKLEKDIKSIVGGRSTASLMKSREARENTVQALVSGELSLGWADALKAVEGELPNCAGPTKPVTQIFEEVFPDGPLEVARTQGFRDATEKFIRITFEAARDCVKAYTEAKREAGLIDFTDQEARALKLLKDPEGEASQWVRESFDVLVVDEFQDTSPLQLAIFLRIGELVSEVRWVGDPKQSIYGFRGADPVLMETAAAAIHAGGGTHDSLDKSWRSSGMPLMLSNEYFSRAFADQENVRLSIDDARRVDRPDIDTEGRLSVWTWGGGNTSVDTQLVTPIVEGIRELKAENPEQEIAVLVRTNTDAQKVLAGLRRADIPATGKGVSADEEVEAMLLVAALRYCADVTDESSLFELITLLPEHPAHATWFNQLASAPDKTARRALKKEWKKDPILAAVADVAQHSGQLSPSRAITELIDALDLRGRIASAPSPSGRYGTLLGFLEQAKTYEDDHEGVGSAATLAGFLREFDAEQKSPTGLGVVARASLDEGNVFVTTMHGSKGLGWNTVVLGLKTPPKGFKLDDAWTEPAPANDFTLEEPLAGRTLMFWPYTLRAAKGTKKIFESLPLIKARQRRLEEENVRLAYVAMTRSKEHTVLAVTEHDLGSHAPFASADVNFDYDEEKEALVISSTGTELVSVDADFHAYSDDVVAEPTAFEGTQRMLPAWRGESTRTAERKAARFAASLVTSEGWKDRADTAVVATLGARLVEHGEMDWNKVGDAIHTYLGTSYTTLDEAAQLAHAEAILGRWGVSAIEAKDLVEAGRRWDAWLTENYPDAPRLTEVPMRYLADGQVAEGWIDMLLDTGDDTVVLIDHKSNPGNEDPAEFVKQHYLGQMATYRAALEAAGKCCDRILIHLPLAGVIMEVTFRDEPSA